MNARQRGREATLPRGQKQKPRSRLRAGFLRIGCLAMTYSRMGKPHTTIGEDAFHD
jgi:hypothetical protein